MGQIIDGAFYSDYDGQDIDRRLALAGGVSNPNLLNNPWFTVNQRGATTVTTGYGADRWIVGGGTEAVFSANGVTLNSVLLIQLLENQLRNATYTASALFSDGTIRKGTVVKSDDTSTLKFINDADIKIVYFASLLRFDINTAGISSGLTIRAVKLEVGSVSTLANDVAPNYTTEFLKCRRYFKRILADDIGLGIAVSASLFDVFIPNDVPMVSASPTYVFSGTLSLYDTAGTITGIAIVRNANNANLAIRFNATGMTTGAVSRLNISSGGHIDISADL